MSSHDIADLAFCAFIVWLTLRFAYRWGAKDSKAMSEPRPVRWILDLGTDTKWGKVSALYFSRGERYYFMVKNGDVALMPAYIVEAHDEAPK